MEKLKIAGVPAVIYGDKSEQAYLFIHGKCGNKEEAERFAEIAEGYQVLSIDLPCHGERISKENEFFPWVAVPEIKEIFLYMSKRWKKVSVRANSIGAYFSMLALDGENIEKYLFVSPILDMEKLITDMMAATKVSEKELENKKEIETEFGETLSWRYYCFAKENRPKMLGSEVHILYGENDNMTSRETVEKFCGECLAEFTLAKSCEHWFHTPEQMKILSEWEKEKYKEK